MQEGILLGFVEAMNFVNEKDRSFSEMLPVCFRAIEHLAYILDAGGYGTELKEIGLSLARNYACKRRLAAPRGSPQNHRWDLVILDQYLQRPPLTEQVFLSDKLGERHWPDAFSKRCVCASLVR
jgi:hypothetical protein